MEGMNITIKKNDIITLEITDITAEGSGVGHENGMAVFVPSAAKGDIISCRIVKVLKNLCYGIVEEIITPSPDRQYRGCDVKKACGGCVFRHISYESELDIKNNIVKNAFIRLGKFEDSGIFMPPLGCDETDKYRNKAQYPVTTDKNGRLTCGFYAQRSHRVVPCTDCLLQPDTFGELLREILKLANERHISAYDEASGKGILRHIYLRRGYHSGEIMVCFVSSKPDPKFQSIADILMKNHADIKSVILNINSKNTNVIMGSRCITLGGSDTITDIMCGNRISLSPLSFYQVNTAQAEKLYGIAAEFAALTGDEDVLDLYCGAGTIGLSMAGKAKHITGAEIIPQAVENAKLNARENGIENADFICADAGQAAKLLCDKGRAPDVIITDPPRKGCDAPTLDSIVKMSPKRVVMVSCNPATAARDCRCLADKGYELQKVRAVDLFPGTGHVETVVLLSKGEVDSKKIRVEFSLEDMDMSEFQDGATYPQIKEYVLEHTGLKVSNLYISQIKRKCGLEVGKNYNLPKSEDSRQPQCPPEKEKAIREAFKYFGMI